MCIRDRNKKAAIGLVLSAAICAFVCGVTEPFEFGFMFLCFPLYVVYAAQMCIRDRLWTAYNQRLSVNTNIS